MKKIIIGICTHYRNKCLKFCIEKINSITRPKDTQIEIVVVDNSKEAFAQKTIERLQHNSYPIHYCVFDGVGIAAVRNKVLEICKSLNPDYIALIDDDEFPSDNWLTNLYDTINLYNANIISGPVKSKFVNYKLNEIKVPKHISQNKIFNLHPKRKTGKVCNSCSTNNVLFQTKILIETNIKFDEKFNKMSGEDLDFFERLTAHGYKIVWCKEAFVTELVPPDRSNIQYILKRNFNNGYLKTFNKKNKKSLYTKHFFNTLINILFFHAILPFSILTGFTNFIKIMCQCAFNLGAMYSVFTSKTFNLYD